MSATSVGLLLFFFLFLLSLSWRFDFPALLNLNHVHFGAVGDKHRETFGPGVCPSPTENNTAALGGQENSEPYIRVSK